MGENKGKGVKGNPFDELTGVGTSQAGPTGTVGNLNSAGHGRGKAGMPDPNDDGNLQNAPLGEHGDFPALGHGGRGRQNRQSAQPAAESDPTATDEKNEDTKTGVDPNARAKRTDNTP